MRAAALAAIKILDGGMRLAESAARRARDHAVDEGGLPAGFTPPCWRNNIAVVDNDASSTDTGSIEPFWNAGSFTLYDGS